MTTPVRYGRVNVEYTPSMGDAYLIPGVGTEAACAGTGGWYYGDPDAPTTIHLCPSSCAAVGDDPEGRVSVALGCETVLL